MTGAKNQNGPLLIVHQPKSREERLPLLIPFDARQARMFRVLSKLRAPRNPFTAKRTPTAIASPRAAS